MRAIDEQHYNDDVFRQDGAAARVAVTELGGGSGAPAGRATTRAQPLRSLPTHTFSGSTLPATASRVTSAGSSAEPATATAAVMMELSRGVPAVTQTDAGAAVAHVPQGVVTGRRAVNLNAEPDGTTNGGLQAAGQREAGKRGGSEPSLTPEERPEAAGCSRMRVRGSRVTLLSVKHLLIPRSAAGVRASGGLAQARAPLPADAADSTLRSTGKKRNTLEAGMPEGPPSARLRVIAPLQQAALSTNTGQAGAVAPRRDSSSKSGGRSERKQQAQLRQLQEQVRQLENVVAILRRQLNAVVAAVPSNQHHASLPWLAHAHARSSVGAGGGEHSHGPPMDAGRTHAQASQNVTVAPAVPHPIRTTSASEVPSYTVSPAGGGRSVPAARSFRVHDAIVAATTGRARRKASKIGSRSVPSPHYAAVAPAFESQSAAAPAVAAAVESSHHSPSSAAAGARHADIAVPASRTREASHRTGVAVGAAQQLAKEAAAAPAAAVSPSEAIRRKSPASRRDASTAAAAAAESGGHEPSPTSRKSPVGLRLGEMLGIPSIITDTSGSGSARDAPAEPEPAQASRLVVLRPTGGVAQPPAALVGVARPTSLPFPPPHGMASNAAHMSAAGAPPALTPTFVAAHGPHAPNGEAAQGGATFNLPGWLPVLTPAAGAAATGTGGAGPGGAATNGSFVGWHPVPAGGMPIEHLYSAGGDGALTPMMLWMKSERPASQLGQRNETVAGSGRPGHAWAAGSHGGWLGSHDPVLSPAHSLLLSAGAPHAAGMPGAWLASHAVLPDAASSTALSPTHATFPYSVAMSTIPASMAATAAAQPHAAATWLPPPHMHGFTIVSGSGDHAPAAGPWSSTPPDRAVFVPRSSTTGSQ